MRWQGGRLAVFARPVRPLIGSYNTPSFGDVARRSSAEGQVYDCPSSGVSPIPFFIHLSGYAQLNSELFRLHAPDFYRGISLSPLEDSPRSIAFIYRRLDIVERNGLIE